MNIISKKAILATVDIANVESFDVTAKKLGIVIDGIDFEKEESGRFEEVPAFIAKDLNSSAEFILFGIPKGESGDAYTLELTAKTDLSIQDFKKSTITFLNSFLIEKNVNSRGYLDYSDEMADALIMKGIKASKSFT